MANTRDYYEILGVARDADNGQLKSAYRKLALQYHPDRNPSNPQAAERFREASEAYAILSDPEKRARYDRFGEAAFSRAQGAGFGGFDPSSFDFADLFGEIFGFGAAGATAPESGSDLVYRMEISFRDAAFGVEAPLVLSRLERCSSCGGSGAEPGTQPKRCPACGGRGRQRFSQGFLSVTRPCGNCRGEGTIIEKPCRECHGEGRRRGTHRLEIRVPPGVETGTRLRLSGEGDAGKSDAPAGDLYVVLTVAEHEVFRREGDDIVLPLELPYPTLVLGGEVTVPTLEGEEKVTIPAGTQVGAEVRLRGRGFGRLGHRGRGDLLVRAGVRIPESPSSKERDLLRDYAKLVDAPVAKPGVAEKAKKIFS